MLALRIAARIVNFVFTPRSSVNHRLLTVLLIVLGVANVRAQLVQSENFTFTGNTLSTNVSFQQWNPSGGSLTSVTFAVTNAAVSGAFYVLNGQSTNITVSNPRTQQIFSFAGGGAPGSIFNSTQSLTNVLYTMPGGLLAPADDGFVILTAPQSISLNGYSTTFTDPAILSYFTGTNTVTLSILSSFNLTGIGSIANLDKSGLTTAGTAKLSMVPEPSTFALLLLGACGFGFAAWRRRQG